MSTTAIPIPQDATVGEEQQSRPAAVPIPDGARLDHPTEGAIIKAAPAVGSKAWFKEKLYNAVDATLESLPGIGATGGAIIGGGAGLAAGGAPSIPGAVGGAGIGGMAGEAARQIGKRAIFDEGPQTSGESAIDITKEGAVQGLIQAITEGMGKFLPPALKDAAENQYLKALKPTTQENKAIAQHVTPEMIQRGIHGSTEDIEARAADEIVNLKPQLNATYAGLPANATRARNPIYSTLSDLDAMKGKYLVDGKVVNQNAYDAIEATQQIISQHKNDISPQSLRKIKQIFDESVSEAGGYTNNDLTTNYELKAQKAAANRIREILHSSAPDAAALDKEMSFWLDVQQVARATNLRRAGQEGGLLKTLAPIGTGLAGGAMGLSHGIEGGAAAAVTSAATTYVAQAMRTPAWRTTSAVVKNQLANALARGDVQMTAALLARLGVAIPESALSGQPPSRSAPLQQLQP